MRIYISLLCFFIIFVSCTDESKYFNGEINILKPFEKEVVLVGKSLELDDIYADAMTVYDSLIMFSADFVSHYFYIFNVFTGRKIGEYCLKGRGANEYIDFTNMEQFVVDKDIKLWVSDVHRNQKLLNVTRSLNEHKEIYDSIIPIRTRGISIYPFTFVFMLNNNQFVAKTQCQELYEKGNEYRPGSYKVYEGKVEKPVKEFILYNKPVINKVREIHPATPYGSRDRIKPDKSKLVMAMNLLAQINILDIQKGTLQAFRLPGTPDFNYLTEDPQNFRDYYVDVRVDNDYIYALYADKGGDERYNNRNCHIVHVFDWNGTPKYKLDLSPVVTQIAIDPVNKKLYGKNNMEEIYVYDLQNVLSYN